MVSGTSDADVATGSKCKATLRLRVTGPIKVRASAKSVEGFAGAHSKRIKLGGG